MNGFHTPLAVSYPEIGSFNPGALDMVERRKDDKREVGTVKKEKEKDAKAAKNSRP